MTRRFPAWFGSSRNQIAFLIGAGSLCAVVVASIGSRQPLSSGAPVEIALPPPPRLILTNGAFSKGVTLDSALRKAQLSAREAYDIGGALGKVLDPRSLRESDKFELTQSTGGAFLKLLVRRQFKEYVVERGADAALTAGTRDIPLVSETRSKAGVLRESLWSSMIEAGLTPDVIVGVADVFAWTIDFLTEPRVGDRFAVVWESQATESGEVAGRRILSAVYDGKQTGRRTAVLFNGDYYDAEGDSLRKAFLAAPLNFRRISSGFSRKRFHPVLRTWRPHLGIDYAAPTGTPVVSVGNGTVGFKGWKTAYGNYLEVRHNGTYTTCYGHLSRFAKGMRPGVRVTQGQVIGYVGSTGWSTGPHLDFRVKKDGAFVNFLKLKFPPDKSVPKADRERYDALLAEESSRLERLLAGINASPTAG